MRPSLDQTYLEMLKVFATRSTCARRQVAAIAVNAYGCVLSTGYNGTPHGHAHCTEEPCEGALDPSGDTSRCHAVHAEANALLQCRDVQDIHTIYCSCTPCFQCAKMIANTGTIRVVVNERYSDPRGLRILHDSNIKVDVIDPAEPTDSFESNIPY